MGSIRFVEHASMRGLSGGVRGGSPHSYWPALWGWHCSSFCPVSRFVDRQALQIAVYRRAATSDLVNEPLVLVYHQRLLYRRLILRTVLGVSIPRSFDYVPMIRFKIQVIPSMQYHPISCSALLLPPAIADHATT
jgi:hypothetical protein